MKHTNCNRRFDFRNAYLFYMYNKLQNIQKQNNECKKGASCTIHNLRGGYAAQDVLIRVTTDCPIVSMRQSSFIHIILRK